MHTNTKQMLQLIIQVGKRGNHRDKIYQFLMTHLWLASRSLTTFTMFNRILYEQI